jgi:ATP-dependent Lon protease
VDRRFNGTASDLPECGLVDECGDVAGIDTPLTSVNLGGSLEALHNAVPLAEMAVEKGATSILVPVSARKQMIALSDDMAAKIDVQFYADPREALLKALAE